MKSAWIVIAGFISGVLVVILVSYADKSHKQDIQTLRDVGANEYALAEAQWCRMTKTVINYEQIDSIYETIKTK